MLDITPVKDDGMTSCYDVQLESVGKWKGIGYELMYLDNWKFLFKEESTKGEGIWERGVIAPRLYFDNLLETNYLIEKFHGIHIDFIDIPLVELESALDSILDKRLPVLLPVDTYNLPWLNGFYGNIHSRHIILVVGKSKNEGYYCNDTRPYLQEPIAGGLLTLKELNEGYAGGIGHFKISEPQYSFEDICKILKNIDFNMFNSMREFSRYIKENEILSDDIDEFDGGDGIIVRAIRNIVRARIHFQKSLKYINYKYNEICLDSNVNSFNIFIDKWKIIKGLFYKSYIKGDYSCNNIKISKIINELADEEEEAAINMMKELSSIR
ncbi:hypothetical protein acsn021_03120 [Anaerocolumna cellulosilytica]|uniref:Uncharacterized protein n=1 Tax=Anaerocolumna cellulosilytica TaxID=433286 RepID=A0A6S6QN16_9FIRM|nr:hypothetical protein [Anaerocolumna cellulosilytica]MBB5197300.1 hypothetical protein [Anaerocolumna cellulosilytica]BCJ92743.1 hypothetical protein acsn021_03120 [Anaerocolumna cellulosilytica]